MKRLMAAQRARIRKAIRMGESGQVLAEYSIMLFSVVLISLALLGLLAAFTEYGWRIIELVAWEP